MRHLHVHQRGRTYLISPPAWPEPPPEWLFDPDGLRARGLLQGSGSGRRPAWFLEQGGTALVLRHYWRGGMVARLSADVYLWTGLRRSRPYRELLLLAELHGRGLPVPEPVAARVRRQGPGYRGDLLTRRIPGAEPLAARIAEGGAPHGLWHAVGATLARFHAAGARHADLNVRNILLDPADGVWLIDWDQGRIGTPHEDADRQLARLRRSLSREPDLEAAAGAGWEALLEGYRAACTNGPGAVGD